MNMSHTPSSLIKATPNSIPSDSQLSKKIDKLEKAQKKFGKKGKKCHYKDCDSNSEQGVGLGSTSKAIKLGETIKNMNYTLPSPMKAIPTSIASDSNDVSTALVSKAGDVMMTSSDQLGELLIKNMVKPNKDPSEGKPPPQSL